MEGDGEDDASLGFGDAGPSQSQEQEQQQHDGSSYDAASRPGQSGSRGRRNGRSSEGGAPRIDPSVKRAAVEALQAADGDNKKSKKSHNIAIFNWLPRGGKKDGVRDAYARISCEACRKKKSKCVLPAGTMPTPTPLQGDDRCGRCLKLDIPCVLWAESRRKELELITQEGIDIASSGEGHAQFLEVLRASKVAKDQSKQEAARQEAARTAATSARTGGSGPTPQWPPPFPRRSDRGKSTSSAGDGGSPTDIPGAAPLGFGRRSLRSGNAPGQAHDDTSDGDARTLWPAGPLQVFRPFADASRDNSAGNSPIGFGAALPPPPPPPAPSSAGLAVDPALAAEGISLGSSSAIDPALSALSAPISTPGGDFAHGHAQPQHEPTTLARAASLMGNPYSLFSQFCYQQSGFASNFQARRLAPPQPGLDPLDIVDDELHASLEKSLLPYLLYVPHMFDSGHVRTKLQQSPTPSARLLLATIYLLAMRSALGSRNMLLSQAQADAERDDSEPPPPPPPAPKPGDPPQSFEQKMMDLHEQLRAIIRTSAEDVLLSFNAGRDDYAVQALELLALYHPLALERVSGTTADTADENVPTLAEELIESARLVASRLRYDKRSTPACSLTYWFLALGGEHAAQDIPLSQCLDLTSAAMHESSRSFERFMEKPAHTASAAQPEEAGSGAARATRGSRAKGKQPAGFEPAAHSPVQAQATLEQSFRAAGRIGLAGRMQILALQHKYTQALRAVEQEHGKPSEPIPALTLAIDQILKEGLEAIEKSRDAAMEELKEQGAETEDSDREFQSNGRTLLISLQLEALQASTTLTSLCASACLCVDPSGAVHATSMTVLSRAKGAEPPLRSFLHNVGSLRGRHIYYTLSLVSHLIESNAVEAVPVTTLCAASVTAGKIAMEEVAAKILGWNHKPDDMDTIIALLSEAAQKLAGFEALSADERKEVCSFGIRDGDLRVTSSAVLAAFAQALKQWRSRLMDISLPVKSFEAPTLDVIADAPPPPAFDAWDQLNGAALPPPPPPPMGDAPVADDGRDPLLEALFSDEPDWGAIFAVLQQA